MRYESELTLSQLADRLAARVAHAMCKGEAETYEAISDLITKELTELQHRP